jgi:hypothetical protein
MRPLLPQRGSERLLRRHSGQNATRAAPEREMFAHVAGFPAIKTLDRFAFDFAGVLRPQIHQLVGLSFIEGAENVVFVCFSVRPA